MIEHWLADPMNLGLILCASMWFAFAYNLVFGTFEGMPWARERLPVARDFMPRIPGEFTDLGSITQADVDALLKSTYSGGPG